MMTQSKMNIYLKSVESYHENICLFLLHLHFFSFCVDPKVVYIILFNFVLRTALGGR